jgi:hypothetical protein
VPEGNTARAGNLKSSSSRRLAAETSPACSSAVNRALICVLEDPGGI